MNKSKLVFWTLILVTYPLLSLGDEEFGVKLDSKKLENHVMVPEPVPLDTGNRYELLLFDVVRKRGDRVTEIELKEKPERVYLARTVRDGKYQHFITGDNGNLFDPPMFILSGSVLREDRLGGKNLDNFYMLTPGNRWLKLAPPDPGTEHYEEVYLVGDVEKGKELVQHLYLPRTKITPRVARDNKGGTKSSRTHEQPSRR